MQRAAEAYERTVRHAQIDWRDVAGLVAGIITAIAFYCFLAGG